MKDMMTLFLKQILVDRSTDFSRDGDRAQNTFWRANKFKANCSGAFDELACVRKNQWVGGIEYIDHPRQPLVLQCCSFEGLRFSQDVGVTTISAGEAVTGGEVIRDGRQISFDVIANVRKVIDPEDKSVSYEVTVRRMNCLPDPPEIEVAYEQDIDDEIYRVLGTAGNTTLKSKEIEPPIQKYKKKPVREPKRKPSKQRKRPNSEFAFGAPNFDPIKAPSNPPTRYPKITNDDEPEAFTMQPYHRTVPARRPRQRPSTTANPLPSTPTTTVAPETTSVFTPVTIGRDQFAQMQPGAVTPAPFNHLQFPGFNFQPVQQSPQLYNPFQLPPHPHFGMVTPAPNPFGFPQPQHEQYYHHQFPGLQTAQNYGVLNPSGFGHAQLSPLAQQQNVISVASPQYSPLSAFQFGQPFGIPQPVQQPVWQPYGQNLQQDNHMPA
ncbi:unnamed protein product, partial [Mesorhabditis spiculigera]